MFDPVLLTKGLALGFSVSAPVGPIGLLCMDRALRHGKLSGFATGLGAAAADTLYGAIAVVGVASVMGFLQGHESQLRLVGGVLLLFLAWRMFRTPPPVFQPRAPGQKRPLLRLFTESFLLTLSNPMTVLGFMAVYAGLGIKAHTTLAVGTVLLGVFLGSAGWWLSLSVGTVLLRHRISSQWLANFSRGAGVMVGLFGLLAIVHGLLNLRL